MKFQHVFRESVLKFHFSTPDQMTNFMLKALVLLHTRRKTRSVIPVKINLYPESFRIRNKYLCNDFFTFSRYRILNFQISAGLFFLLAQF
jgi:hypothetical protein